MSVDPPDIQSVAADVQVLKTQVQSIANSVEALVGRQAAFEKSVSDSRQFKWPVALSAVGAIAIIVTALVQLVDLKTQNAELRSDVKITTMLAPIAAKADTSERDRQLLHDAVLQNAQAIGRMEVSQARFDKDIAEIETQFKASDEFRNVNLAGQMRFVSLLWQKSYGEPFPSEMYFPEISNRRR